MVTGFLCPISFPRKGEIFSQFGGDRLGSGPILDDDHDCKIQRLRRSCISLKGSYRKKKKNRSLLQSERTIWAVEPLHPSTENDGPNFDMSKHEKYRCIVHCAIVHMNRHIDVFSVYVSVKSEILYE